MRIRPDPDPHHWLNGSTNGIVKDGLVGEDQ